MWSFFSASNDCADLNASCSTKLLDMKENVQVTSLLQYTWFHVMLKRQRKAYSHHTHSQKDTGQKNKSFLSQDLVGAMRCIHNLFRSIRDIQNVSLQGTYKGGPKSKVTQILVRHFIVPLYYTMMKVCICTIFQHNHPACQGICLTM
jgi:hypothetical protein